MGDYTAPTRDNTKDVYGQGYATYLATPDPTNRAGNYIRGQTLRRLAGAGGGADGYDALYLAYLANKQSGDAEEQMSDREKAAITAFPAATAAGAGAVMDGWFGHNTLDPVSRRDYMRAADATQQNNTTAEAYNRHATGIEALAKAGIAPTLPQASRTLAETGPVPQDMVANYLPAANKQDAFNAQTDRIKALAQATAARNPHAGLSGDGVTTTVTEAPGEPSGYIVQRKFKSAAGAQRFLEGNNLTPGVNHHGRGRQRVTVVGNKVITE